MADGFNHQHGDKSDHRETAIHPFGVSTPAESGNVCRGGTGGRNRFGFSPLAIGVGTAGGHAQGSRMPKVIAGGREELPATLTIQGQNGVVERFQRGPVADADHREFALA